MGNYVFHRCRMVRIDITPIDGSGGEVSEAVPIEAIQPSIDELNLLRNTQERSDRILITVASIGTSKIDENIKQEENLDAPLVSGYSKTKNKTNTAGFAKLGWCCFWRASPTT